jgi:hypothetical protein
MARSRWVASSKRQVGDLIGLLREPAVWGRVGWTPEVGSRGFGDVS